MQSEQPDFPMDEAPEAGSFDLSAYDLEPHVEEALTLAMARARSRGSEVISAGDILEVVSALGHDPKFSPTEIYAFPNFLKLLPKREVTTDPVPETAAPLDLSQLRVSDGVAKAARALLDTVTRTDSAAQTNRVLGRDLVTSAILAVSDPSLRSFAEFAGTGLRALQSGWRHYVETKGSIRGGLDWDAVWRLALEGQVADPEPHLIDPAIHPLVDGFAPDWADGWGDDEHGVFLEVSLKRAMLRLRWIPPGRFRMGSPEEEPGRFDREGPQVDVTFRSGFWLMDAPVTQVLWEEVMGSNPSKFVDAERPVEQVSFNDAEAFLAELNVRVPGLDLRLPSEAEWEYACRAGTETAIWTGPLEIRGTNNAPALDAIAWYGGNSGVGFDLEDGWDARDWKETQYDFQRAGTRKVRLKQANPWGCHDMLGNVWEWCADASADSHEGADPEGGARQASQHATEVARVIRGGSWYGGARYVRAAFRIWDGPESRRDDLGFRCARGQASSGRLAPEAHGAGGPQVRAEDPRAVAGAAPEPDATQPLRKFVLVAGKSGRLNRPLELTCRRIGMGLAEAGFALVTGGWSGVDRAVSTSFARRAAELGRDVDADLLQIIPKGQRRLIDQGGIIRVADDDAAYDLLSETADACLVINGLGGAYSTGEAVLELGKPVFAMQASGGDAEDLFQRVVKNWESMASAGMTLQAYKAAMSGEASDVLALLEQWASGGKTDQ